MKTTVILFILITSFNLFAQSTVNGTVTDEKGNPVEGANVYLDATYDGATTDAQGKFNFETSETGEQLLLVTFLSYEPYSFHAAVSDMQNLVIKLREDVSTLDAVVLSAGTFEAGDNSKVSVLKPLDVVTTASALGDFVGALQTLPGTTTVAEDGRLFVRGGDASETQIFIDGIRVFTPYTPTSNNAPTRGRYSPFLFDGITFSTGGYSAEYGQALSSVLLLNTIDEPDQDQTDISIMSVGLGLGHTKKWKESSLSVNTSYMNLAPYLELFPSRNDWKEPYQTFAGEAVFRQKTKNGLVKLYTAFDHTNLALTQEDINYPDGLDFALKNQNLYFNGTYSGVLSDTWSVQSGLSYTLAKNDLGIQATNIDNTENSIHAKAKFKKRFSNRFKLNFGAEYLSTDFKENYSDDKSDDAYDTGVTNNIEAAFTEADIIFSKKFAMKLGLRGEYSELLNEATLSPRASLAYKTGKNSQFSVAYGDFYQNPTSEYLKFNSDFDAQKTSHYIFNYLYTGDGTILRAEAYRKTYNKLVTFDTDIALPTSIYGNEGNGYAQGLDIFWRDNKNIKNLDYWVSYSYLDSKRKYLNYPEESTPNFAQSHNFSLVTKYWIEDWKSQVGFSYQFASGRNYTDYNKPGFLQEKTKSYNNLSLNWAYLLSQQKILYFSIQNVLGFKNVNGYQYADAPDMTGVFNRKSMRPAADQFFFVGFFWTISTDKSTNQLDNL